MGGRTCTRTAERVIPPGGGPRLECECECELASMLIMVDGLLNHAP